MHKGPPDNQATPCFMRHARSVLPLHSHQQPVEIEQVQPLVLDEEVRTFSSELGAADRRGKPIRKVERSFRTGIVTFGEAEEAQAEADHGVDRTSH